MTTYRHTKKITAGISHILFSLTLLGLLFLAVPPHLSAGAAIHASSDQSEGLDLFLLIDQSGSMGGSVVDGVVVPPSDPEKSRFDIPRVVLEVMSNWRYTMAGNKDLRLGLISFGDRVVTDLAPTQLVARNEQEAQALQARLINTVSTAGKYDGEAKNLGNTDHRAAIERALAEWQSHNDGIKRQKVILIITDGAPYVMNNPNYPFSINGENSATEQSYLSELNGYVKQNAPDVEFYVLGIYAPSEPGYWNRLQQSWADLAGADHIKGINSSKSEAGDYTHQVLYTLLDKYATAFPGTAQYDSISLGPLPVQPYLSRLEFFVAKNNRDEHILFALPDGNTLDLQNPPPGVNVYGYNSTIEYITIKRPLPGIWSLTTVNNARPKITRVQFQVNSIALMPQQQVVPYFSTPLTYTVKGADGESLEEYDSTLDPKRLYPLSGELSYDNASGDSGKTGLKYSGPGKFTAEFVPLRKGEYQVNITIKTHNLDGSDLVLFDSSTSLAQGPNTTVKVDNLQLGFDPAATTAAFRQFAPTPVEFFLTDSKGTPINGRLAPGFTATGALALQSEQDSPAMKVAPDSSQTGNFVAQILPGRANLTYTAGAAITIKNPDGVALETVQASFPLLAKPTHQLGLTLPDAPDNVIDSPLHDLNWLEPAKPVYFELEVKDEQGQLKPWEQVATLPGSRLLAFDFNGVGLDDGKSIVLKPVAGKPGRYAIDAPELTKEGIYRIMISLNPDSLNPDYVVNPAEARLTVEINRFESAQAIWSRIFTFVAIFIVLASVIFLFVFLRKLILKLLRQMLERLAGKKEPAALPPIVPEAIDPVEDDETTSPIYPETALLVAYERLSNEHTTETEQAMRDAINRIPWHPAPLKGHNGPVTGGVFSPNGRYVLTASADGTARLCDLQAKLIADFTGHEQAVNSVAVSRNGLYVLTTSDDASARVWNALGQLLATLSGHTARIRGAGFSPDDRLILTYSADGTARLWTLEGKQMAIYTHDGEIRGASFSPDSRSIITASADTSARLWDCAGNLLATFSGHTLPVNSAVVSPDGSQILTASDDATVRIWDRQGNMLIKLARHAEAVRQASYSADGQQILSASDDKTALLWDHTGKLLAELIGHDGPVFKASFNPVNGRILTASLDTTARIWDAGGKELIILSGHTQRLSDAIWARDGWHVLTTSFDGTARIWTAYGPPLPSLHGHTNWVRSAEYSQDGTYILTASHDKTAILWNTKGQPVTRYTGHQKALNGASFSPDKRYVLTASTDATARLWNIPGTEVLVLAGHQKAVNQAIFSPDGRAIVTASNDNLAMVWDLKGQHIATLQGHSAGVTCVAFSPDSRFIVTGSADTSARLWSIYGEPLVTFAGHTDTINSVLFSSDGELVLTTSSDKTAGLWNRQGRLLSTLAGHSNWVLNAIFSPDGSRILTCSADLTARLWTLQGELLVTLSGHRDCVWHIAYNTDGSRILTASEDGTTRLWDADGKHGIILEQCSNGIFKASFCRDNTRVVAATMDFTARQYLVAKDDLLAAAACCTGRDLTEAEIARFKIGTPHFVYDQRRCPPVYSWQEHPLETAASPNQAPALTGNSA